VTPLPRLYLITDRRRVPDGDLSAALEAPLAAGVRLVQLREKDLTTRALCELARAVRAVTDRAGAALLINDRADVALAVGAAGVHLTSADPPVAEARALLGPDALIGVSTHTLDEARAAADGGASFVTFGPVFDTPSKRGMGAPVGLAALAEAVAQVRVPVFALGGIGPARAAKVAATGCHGIAAISAVLGAADPAAAVRALAGALEEHSTQAPRDR
jgi:thiamine-phosphate pyrophosphorylase